MKSIKTFLVILLFSIGNISLVFGDITIESQFFNNDIKIFFIDDFDLTQSGSSPLLFQVKITSDDAVNTKQIALILSITYNGLESGEKVVNVWNFGKAASEKLDKRKFKDIPAAAIVFYGLIVMCQLQ